MTRLKEPNRRHPPWSYNEDLQQSITGMNNCVLHILNVLPIDKGEMSLIAHNLRPLIRTPPLEGGIICVTINLDGGTISPLIKKTFEANIATINLDGGTINLEGGNEVIL